jgi:hypothetical protein
MTLFNNTEQETGYAVSWEDGGDCGMIAAGSTVESDAWDNLNMTVSFVPQPWQPGGAPFSTTIASTGEGKTVTIGLYHE